MSTSGAEVSVAKRTTKASGDASRRTGRAAATKGRGGAARRARTKKAGVKKAVARKAGAKKAARKTSAKGGGRKTARAVGARKGGARERGARRVRTRRAAEPEKPSAIDKAAVAVSGTIAGAVAAVRRTVSSRPPDALALLIADHRRMQKLLAQGEKTTARTASRRDHLLDTITAELDAHELVEEKVLYPALELHPEARDLALEAFQEHHVANVVVEELHRVAADEEQWGAKFTVLKENLEHHIEEEEGEMFRTARGVFSQEELDEMGARMAAMKAERGLK